jgi:predicted DNA-binding transcriptional regulator AlpA
MSKPSKTPEKSKSINVSDVGNGPNNDRPVPSLQPFERLISESEIEDYFGMSRRSLPNARLCGRDHPPFYRIGGRAIRYRLSEVEAWLKARQNRIAPRTRELESTPQAPSTAVNNMDITDEAFDAVEKVTSDALRNLISGGHIKKLDSTELRVLICYIKSMNRERMAYAPTEDIAEKIGIKSAPTINNARNRLVELGLLKAVKHRSGLMTGIYIVEIRD